MLAKAQQRSLKNLIWRSLPQLTCMLILVYLIHIEIAPQSNKLKKIVKSTGLKSFIRFEEEDSKHLSEMPPSKKVVDQPESINFGEKLEEIEYIKNLRNPKVISPHEVESEEKDAINLGFVMVNPGNGTGFKDEFEEATFISFYNLLRYSGATPLHFIIGTDKRSAPLAGRLLSEVLMKRLTQDIMLRRFWRWRKNKTLPKIQVSFANVEEIVSPNVDMIEVIKSHSVQTKAKKPDKYVHNLFYIAPFYHQAFTRLDKVVFLDCTDLDFRVDVAELYAQFNEMKEHEVIGIANDLSPLYGMLLNESGYSAAHPNSELGKPGKFQGLNCGVILFDLEKQRKSKTYNRYTTANETVKLVEKYLGGNLRLGEQDWFTSLQYEHPELFYILPCTFNTQTSVQFLNRPFTETFLSYHYCGKKPEIKIFHANGCGPTPHECKHHGKQENSEKYGGHEMSMNLNVFWIMMMGSVTQDFGNVEIMNAFEDLQIRHTFNDPGARVVTQ